MKKYVYISVLVLLAVVTIFFDKKRQAKEEMNKQSDRDKINQLIAACDQFVKTDAIYSFGDEHTRYIFELELIHQNNGQKHYVTLEKLLGEDFKTKLSDGKSIFVAVLPFRRSYDIRIGGNKDENEIYPKWNYKGLDQMEGLGSK